MLLNVNPEELIALKAAMEIALKAASGYSVRTCVQRDIISIHWDAYLILMARVKALEAKRELNMAHPAKAGHKYMHVAIDEKVHERLESHLMHKGGGKIRSGELGHLVSNAIEQYLDRNPIVIWPGSEHDADAA